MKTLKARSEGSELMMERREMEATEKADIKAKGRRHEMRRDAISSPHQSSNEMQEEPMQCRRTKTS
jgi:hypothetical protein